MYIYVHVQSGDMSKFSRGPPSTRSLPSPTSKRAGPSPTSVVYIYIYIYIYLFIYLSIDSFMLSIIN